MTPVPDLSHSDGVPVVMAATKAASTNGATSQRKVLSDEYYRSKFSEMAKNRTHDGSESTPALFLHHDHD